MHTDPGSGVLPSCTVRTRGCAETALPHAREPHFRIFLLLDFSWASNRVDRRIPLSPGASYPCRSAARTPPRIVRGKSPALRGGQDVREYACTKYVVRSMCQQAGVSTPAHPLVPAFIYQGALWCVLAGHGLRERRGRKKEAHLREPTGFHPATEHSVGLVGVRTLLWHFSSSTRRND